MKKLISLLAVLALVGCEGSGSSNNNPNPNQPNNPNGPMPINNPNNPNPNPNPNPNVPQGGNAAPSQQLAGTWTENGIPQGYSSKLTFSNGSVSWAVTCPNRTVTATAKATYSNTQINILESKQEGDQECGVGLPQGTFAYAVTNNTLEIEAGGQTKTFSR